jgi:hypothetical protein
MEVDARARSEGETSCSASFPFLNRKSKEFTASPQSNED